MWRAWQWLILGVILSLGASEASAQPVGDRWTSLVRPVQGTARFLGFGYSRGYHQKTPGPDCRYYHPYTFQNSNLIARGDEHLFPERGSRWNYHRGNESTAPIQQPNDSGSTFREGHPAHPPTVPSILETDLSLLEENLYDSSPSRDNRRTSSANPDLRRQYNRF